MPIKKQLYRSSKDRIILGVCGGLAEYFNVDPVIMRLLFIIMTFMGGLGILLYIFLAIVMPNDNEKIIVVDRQKNAKDFVEDVASKVEDLAEEISREKSWEFNAKNALAIFLIILGLIMFMKILFPAIFFWLNWGIMWPVVIILIGIYLIAKK